MPRYVARFPPSRESQALADFLAQELRRIELAIQALYDGEIEAQRAKSEQNQTILVYGDAIFDLGGGVGMYLKSGSQWYKLEMTPVAGIFPVHGLTNETGGTPT